MMGLFFNYKYMEYSEAVQNEIISIFGENDFLVDERLLAYIFDLGSNKPKSEKAKLPEELIEKLKQDKYTPEDYDTFLIFKDFGRKSITIEHDECDVSSVDCLVSLVKKEQHKSILSEHKAQYTKYLAIMSRSKLVNTERKTVNSPIPAFQNLTKMTIYSYLYFIDLMENGFDKQMEKEFYLNHKQKLAHFLESNTLIHKMVIFASIERDLSFAKEIYNQYGIKLELDELLNNHMSFQKVIRSEMEGMFNLHDRITKNIIYDNYGIVFKYSGYMSLNYMNEVSANRYLKIIDYYDFKITKDEALKVYEPTFIERFISPIESIYLAMAVPDYLEYRDEYVKYNEDLNFYKNMENK
jgi:hypothetical protein